MPQKGSTLRTRYGAESTRMIDVDFNMINWNIGGAKFLEKPSDDSWKPPKRFSMTTAEPSCREEYHWRLKEALKILLDSKPHVITMQEVVQYEENGKYQNPKDILESEFFEDEGYEYNFEFFPLIDSLKFSAQAKWNKVRKNGEWGDKTYFAQGNAILIRKDILHYPVWSIPMIGVPPGDYYAKKFGIPLDKSGNGHNNEKNGGNILGIARSSEPVFVEKGLYFGDRDTEPRAAIVTHLVLDGCLQRPPTKFTKPIDVFIINLHLTTLTHEREGIPFKDEQATIKRLKQLDIVFNDIISKYNSWKEEEEYRLRGDPYPLNGEIETIDRHKPVWVISGDFNFTPESSEYEYIKKRNFLDLIRDHKIGTKSAGLGKQPTLTVDYVFAGPLYYSIDLNNASHRIIHNHVNTEHFVKVSDHMPIEVTVPIQVEEKV